VDGAGYVYIADTGNNRIVEETNSNGNWTQTTVATGLDSPTGVAVDGTGNVYVSSFTDGAIYKETPSQGAYTQSTLVSGLNESRKIAIDAWGDLYIANTGASQILMETLSAGNYTQTSIGSGLSYAWGVAVTPSGNVLIADTQNSRILLETLSDGTYTQSVLKTGVWAVAVQADDQGTVYIPSTASQTVVKIVSTQPPSLTFASTNLGSTSSDSPQTVVLQNVGNANLNFILPESGTNPSISSGFQLASSNEGNCPSLTGSSEPQSLAPGASCTLPISFMPVSAGADEGSVTLVDNSMNAYPDSIQSIPLTGQGNGKSTTTTAASATAPFSTSAQNVALSASVTSTTTVNAGTVTFTVLHGSTVIGESATSSALTNGNASVSYSLPANTAAGSYTIQAAYSGSGAFEASSNATHTLTIGNGATFALVSTSASTVTQTVAPGQSATYSLAIQAQNTPLTTAVVFSATGLPTGATATFDPPSITPGLTASTFTMTIHTATSYAAASFAHRDLLARGSLVLASSPFMLGILLLPFSGRIRRAAGGHGRKLSLLLLLVVGTALAGLTGCSGYSTSTSQKSYTVTVVGTSGATSHSTTVNLVIE